MMPATFLAGSPLSRKDHEARKEALIAQQIELFLSERNPAPSDEDLRRIAIHEVHARAERKVDRITNKSIGLLQFLALEAAGLSLLLTTNAPLHFWAVVKWMTIVPIVAASFLLLLNLRTVSYRNPNNYRSIELDMELGMKVVARRSLSLHVAIGCTILSLTALAIALSL